MIPRSALFIIIIILFGFIYFLATVMESNAASGQIIVYNEDGTVEKVETFSYTPDKTPYVPPKVKQDPAPEPPKGMRFIQPEEEVEEETEEEKNYRHDVNGKKKKKKSRDALGRRKKIKKIESQRVGDKQVTVVTREETDKAGRVFETKEVQVDNRSSGSRRQQHNANKRAIKTKRFKVEKQKTVYKRRGFP